MKSSKYTNLFLVFFICGILQNSILAQEHGYQWGKWYEGQSIFGSNSKADEVIDSYVDSLGNTYIFGQFGKDARMGGLDAPYICPMDSISDYSYVVQNSTGIFLAKIDSAGNVLWWKWARNGSPNSLCHPWNMVVKDNRITIAMGNIVTSEWWNWFYLFDTMLVEPFITPQWRKEITATYFVTFDFDGNIMDIHDMRLFALRDTNYYSHSLEDCTLISYYNSRFEIDKDNNIHIFSCGEFAMEDSLHKAYIIVDGDSNRRYPLNVHTMNGNYFSSSVYYKMDSNWNLIGSRYLIDSIAGWQRELNNHYVDLANLNFTNVVVDGDEIYVNGYFECGDAYYIAQELSDTESFAATIYLDSIHYLQIDNTRDFRFLPFLLKLDKNGGILWVQQLYTVCPNDDYVNYNTRLGMAIDETDVYNLYWAYDINTHRYLDSTHTIPLVNHTNNHVLIVSYDKVSGTPRTYYFLDTIKDSESISIYVQGDNIVLDVGSLLPQPSTIKIYKINKNTKAITQSFPITFPNHFEITSMSANNNGWISRSAIGSLAFVNDSIFLGNYSESAVMTFYYDSSLDLRRRPCPQVDSLWGSISGMVATLSWNGQSGIADYELSYIPEGGNWDNAFTFETSDTTATLTLLYDRCYQFRIRGHCTRKGKPYSSWSEPFTICPEAGIEGIGGTGSISLSPNPATGRVQVLGLGEELKQIEVIDMKGNVVSTFSNTTSFDITDLPKGSYLVKLQTAAGTTLHHKLVKSN